MNTYENLQIVQSQFFIFIYIGPNLNICWFIGIQICCQEIKTKRYLDTFDYLQYLVTYLMRDNEGKFKLFTIT
jgi:hypothetical protein